MSYLAHYHDSTTTATNWLEQENSLVAEGNDFLTFVCHCNLWQILKGEMSGSRLSIVLNTEEDDKAVFLAGNFNNWTIDQSYQMDKVDQKKFRYDFPASSVLPEMIEYKYLRGDWDEVELDEYGNSTPNRVVNATQTLIEDYVPRWRKNGLAYDPDFLPEIRVISEQFEIPQLIKTRRIAALLPHNYSQSDRKYPVLYLQDGQNLFDEYAPYGNWGLDKKLAVMAEKGIGDIIIVAIDHAEEERIAEFTPSANTKLGRGQGKKYVRFLADTLKPYIDKHFRTLSGRSNTGIGGSSMGGLISIYAGMMYPEVYGRLMVFSPSLWAAPNIHFHAINLEAASDVKIYLYGGGEESINMIPNINNFKTAIEKQGIEVNIDFKISIDPKGKHNEARWGEEFPKAAEWLFYGSPSIG